MACKVLLLSGCTYEPLMSYLKALGILRLVAEQRDTTVRGAWSAGTFELYTKLDDETLLDFFLEEYKPTPIINPWNSASGFWGGKTPSKALQALEESTHPRLTAYRDAIKETRSLLDTFGFRRKPSNKDKPRLLRILRSTAPDPLVAWIDALSALTEDKVTFAPVLGTGGNDGRLEFSVNFMQRLADIIPFNREGWNQTEGRRRRNPAEVSRNWLEAALFGAEPSGLVSAAVGQFHPGGVGGPNATQDFEGDSVVNPWDYVLMLEGSLLLAGSVARRAGRDSRQKPAFPFTVRPSPAGWQTVAHTDAVQARQEIWMPVWERPASLAEIAHLLAEGRVQVGRRPAVNGTDFARAVATLGVDRGLSGFSRFGFVQRSGRAYIAAPLGYLPAKVCPEVQIIEEADQWLLRLGRAARRDGARASLQRAQRAIDDAIFRFCGDGNPRSLQDVLIAMANAAQTVAKSKGLRQRIPPVSGLSLRWLWACDDGSVEFRLSSALASLGRLPPDSEEPAVAFLRSYLEPVNANAGGRPPWNPDSRTVVWRSGGLVRNMIKVLERRCVDAQRGGILHPAPVAGYRTARLQDVNSFLLGEVDDGRIESLLRGLALLRWPPIVRDYRNRKVPVYAPARINRLYALCKLLFHHEPLPRPQNLTDRPQVRPELSLLARLETGNGREAVKIAARRLRVAGLSVLGTSGGRQARVPVLNCSRHLGERIAAALLFPIDTSSLQALMRLTVRELQAQ